MCVLMSEAQRTRWVRVDNFYAVIMAGGGGTRLWPLSRRKMPKQMLQIFADRSLYKIAVDRLLPLIPAERILVVTVADQRRLLQEQTPNIPHENFLLEPEPRGTAAVVGLAASYLQHRDPESVMAVVTADHCMKNEGAFRDVLTAGYQLALEGCLVTLGISPTYPATGYGYIQRGNPLGTYQGHLAYDVLAFHEKPDKNRAESYLQSGEYDWNSGMFIWKSDRILQEIALQMPDLAMGLEKISACIGSMDEDETVRSVWEKLIPETIDYGVMEHAKDVRVLPADRLSWLDIGSWERMFEVYDRDPDGNLVHAEHFILEDCKDSLIYQAGEKHPPRLVAMLGVRDLVVVDMDDVLMICPRKQAEEVRTLVDNLRKSGNDEYL